MIHKFICDTCGITITDTSTKGIHVCTCGKEMRWDLDMQVVTDNPRWSNSMGVPASQVEQFRKLYPNSTYDNDGKLLIKNRSHKLAEMKARGFCEMETRKC